MADIVERLVVEPIDIAYFVQAFVVSAPVVKIDNADIDSRFDEQVPSDTDFVAEYSVVLHNFA
ncbi:hypothetical protein J6P92_09875 [bacterium]|nr:hypothetical protein [bacterium]